MDLHGFTWILMDFSGFKWIYEDLGRFHEFQGQRSWRPVAALRSGLLSLKEDGRLQSCRFGGLDARMPGCLDARRFGGWRLGSWSHGGWLACLLADGIGLDWI